MRKQWAHQVWSTVIEYCTGKERDEHNYDKLKTLPKKLDITSLHHFPTENYNVLSHVSPISKFCSVTSVCLLLHWSQIRIHIYNVHCGALLTCRFFLSLKTLLLTSRFGQTALIKRGRPSRRDPKREIEHSLLFSIPSSAMIRLNLSLSSSILCQIVPSEVSGTPDTITLHCLRKRFSTSS